MAKFHIKPATGEPGECSATAGNCPYGEDALHAATEAEARELFAVTQVSIPAAISRKDSTALAIKAEEAYHAHRCEVQKGFVLSWKDRLPLNRGSNIDYTSVQNAATWEYGDRREAMQTKSITWAED